MKKYVREILATPKEIVTNGHCNMGTFNAPIEKVNPLDADSPLGIRLPKAIQNLRLKEWEAFQISNSEWFICLAVYNTKSLGTAIIMAYNRVEDALYRYETKAPACKLTVPSGLQDSHCFYHGSGFSIDIYNELKNGQFRVQFHATGFKNLPDMRGDFVGYHVTEPIVVIQPFGKNRPLYSHKALMPCEGKLTTNGTISEFGRKNACMIIDDHKGFYPYVMKYDWITGCGYDASSRLVGFNITFNQIQDHERYNENCLWLDGKMYPLPPVVISRPEGVEKTWIATDEYGVIKLRFTPLKDSPIIINAGIVATRYHGPIGRLSGTITAPTGEIINFEGFPGMGEQKYIRM